MADIQEFKCPACGGALEFDSRTQKMKCPYCDTQIDVEAMKSLDEDIKKEQPDNMEWETKAGSEWQESEKEGMRVYICKSCGGEIMGDVNTAAASCPFCGNQVVMQEQFADSLRPDYVIPFKLDKKAAKAAYRKHLKGKRLLPGVFKDENHIDEIRGVYVPFWLFDADADASIRYRGSRVRVWSDSDYNYTKTSFYAIYREGKLAFERVPVDGSTKMEDALMESIEPFRFEDAVDFQTAYLAGYLADKYDVMAEESIARANSRIKESTEQNFRDTVNGYGSVITQSCSIRLENGTAKYALYPVWMLNTTWGKEKFTFAMNGQTGKFVGDLPVDKGALWRWRAGLTAVFSVIVYGLLWLFW